MLRPETVRLLAELKTISGDRLSRSDDLGILLDLGASSPAERTLKELGFLAKFLSRTHAIMARIGTSGDGYETLEKEFHENLTKASSLAQELLRHAPADVAGRFRTTYFSMTPDSISNLLSLLRDLSWYKNWLLDHDRVSP